MAFLAAAEQAPSTDASTAEEPSIQYTTPTLSTVSDPPASFADGRYQVKRFLGEGGKKRVYLAHDTYWAGMWPSP